MCGIIGYVGPRRAKPLLIHGLERLEEQIVRLDGDATSAGPNSDDLEALANAVREAARPNAQPPVEPSAAAGTGRRGHLRVLRPPS